MGFALPSRAEASSARLEPRCLSALVKYNKSTNGVSVTNDGRGFHFAERRPQLMRTTSSARRGILSVRIRSDGRIIIECLFLR